MTKLILYRNSYFDKIFFCIIGNNVILIQCSRVYLVLGQSVTNLLSVTRISNDYAKPPGFAGTLLNLE